MRILLDTHIALWAVTDDPKLPAFARRLICDPESTIHVSVASLWEIAIKHALALSGRRAMPVPAGEAEGYFRSSGYAILPVTAAHVRALETLPPHHSDPFDRMLIAQGRSEPMTLVTHDRALATYGPGVVAA